MYNRNRSEAYADENQLDKIIKDLLEMGLFNFCGIKVVSHQILPAVASISEVEKAALKAFKEMMKKHF